MLPSAISALSATLAGANRPLELKFLEKHSYGTTDDGTRVHDIRLTATATGYTTVRRESAEISEALNNAAKLANRLNRKSARLYYRGLQEKDRLKRFLNFYMAIEIHVHATFGAIDHPRFASSIFNSRPEFRASTEEFFSSQVASYKNARDRFVWCAITTWENLEDADLATFDDLRKTRNQIAHGVIEQPSYEAALAAQSLAAKILDS